MNMIDKDMQELTRLYDKGLIDSEAFISAIKKVVEKNTPVTPPLVGKPFIPTPIVSPANPWGGDIVNLPHHIPCTSGTSWKSKGDSGMTAKYDGLSVPDIYSGSILKKNYYCSVCGRFVSNQEYHDCKEQNKLYRDCKIQGVKGMTIPVNPAEQVSFDLVPYSENRSHLPEHAQAVLGWIDEAWDEAQRKYEESKKDWSREVNAKGKIEWKHIPSEEMEEDVKQLGHIFNLQIDDCDC